MLRKSAVNKDIWGYIFLLPFSIVCVFFILYPIINTFWLSVTDSNLVHPNMRGDFIGLDNFRLLAGSAMFRTAVGNTWRIWLSNFIPQIVLALVLAAMFSSTTFKIKGSGFFKAMYYLPNLLMPVTVAAFFNYLLGVHGPINQLLVGNFAILDSPRDFLMNVFDTRFTVVFIQTWLWFGSTAIILVAGMSSISPSLYESGMVDGASQVKMFFRITLPLLKPVILFILVTSLVGGMGMFDIPQLLTGSTGPPNNSVLTVTMYMNNRRSFPAGMIGSAAAISVALFFMSSLIALILFRLFREKPDHVEGKKRRFGRKQKAIEGGQ